MGSGFRVQGPDRDLVFREVVGGGKVWELNSQVNLRRV